jgi:protein SCO1/2
MARRRFVLLCLAAVLVAAGCRQPDPAEQHAKHYDLRGQVVDVRPDIGEIRLRHEEIPGYMAAMTMSFAVKDRALLAGRKPGDLVSATLVVTDTDAWLSSLEKTGEAPIPPEPDDLSEPAPAFTLLEPGQAVPDEGFTDQDGRPWRPSSMAGKAYALTFIYTRCPLPTYCPLMNRNFRAAQQAVASNPDARARVRFVTVSFDPDHDTPAVLKQHATAIGADLSTWTFATAPRDVVDPFAAKFGVSVIRDPKTPGEITHNLRTAVVSPSGTIVKIYGGNEWTPVQLAADLEGAASR